jgi:pimeloyl-ACP methyl ester carboxylesterase
VTPTLEQPQIRYAKSGDVHIAYTVLGNGPLDLVIVPGFVSHLEIMFENPKLQRFGERLTKFARLIVFDKRGTGMSDPVAEVPTLEQRMDDVRAVMDAVGCESAALMGVSEGATMCALFAATYPARARALVLYGGMARSTWAPDYPWASPREALEEAVQEFMAPAWGTGEMVEIFAPSEAGDPAMRAWYGRLQRMAASPGMLAMLQQAFLDTDIRDTLPLVQAPTLVLHRRGDRVVNINAGRYLAEHIPGARFVELPGIDHSPFAGDVDALVGEVEEFLTGTRATPAVDIDRVLATVMFTDLVGSTERAAAMGDAKWRGLLEQCHALTRQEIERHRGVVVKTIGDGCLARFDGPARAIRAAQSVVNGMKPLGLEMRAGLHTGEVELMGDDVGGIAVHIGARVSAKAAAGEVLVSSTVKDLVAGSGLTFVDHGLHILKGVPDEWHLFAVSG